MPDENGVVTFRVTRITMIDAVRDAVPAAPGRGLRRARPVDHAAVADAILAALPEAEPAPLKAVASAERIIAARDTEIEGLRREITTLGARLDGQYALIRAKDEQAAEAAEQIAALTMALARTEERADADAGFALSVAEILNGVPGLSQAGDADLVTAVRELAGKYLAAGARLAELDNAITWQTSCTACARLLGTSIDEHDRADRAEQALAPLKAALELFAAPGAWTSGERRKAASEALRAGQAHADAAGVAQ